MHTAAKGAFLQRFRELILLPRGRDHRVQFPGPGGTNAVEAALELARHSWPRRISLHRLCVPCASFCCTGAGALEHGGGGFPDQARTTACSCSLSRPTTYRTGRYRTAGPAGRAEGSPDVNVFKPHDQNAQQAEPLQEDHLRGNERENGWLGLARKLNAVPNHRLGDGFVETIFDSGDFPARDALPAWEKAIADAVMPTSFKLIGTGAFRAYVGTMPLGAAQVSAMTYSSYLTRRTPKLIRSSDPEILAVGLTNSGAHVIEQNRNRAAPRPGELLLFESSRPFETYADGGSTLLQFPRTLLPLPDRHINQLICRVFPGDQGMGRLLTAFLTHLAEDSTSYTPHDTVRLGTVGLDLVTATLAHFLERESDIPHDSRQRVLYMDITSFIERHLGDTGLTAGEVAAAHHISIRSLHRLFQQHGMTVRSWIREQRLERCRRDLADPLKHHVPIQAIAARWGFPRPADFTRVFRALHGMTPSDYRNQAHHPSTQAGTPG